MDRTRSRPDCLVPSRRHCRARRQRRPFPPRCRDEPARRWHRAVNEIVPADRLLARAREIAEGLAALPPLATSYTRIAMTQKLRRIVDEGVGYGLALEGISAADVARRER